MIKKKLMRLIIVLLLVTILTLVYWASNSFSFNEDSQEDNLLEIQLTEWAITPQDITLNKGETIQLIIVNKGTYPHDFVIPELDIKTRTLSPNQEESLTFAANKSMTLKVFCSLPGHKESGMEAQISVK
jgi:uncharacterized cupredoxin-like copper-binding protein